MLEEQAESVRHLEGDMAEVGVWKGRTASLIHQQVPEKILHLYDTFCGIVKSDKSVDVHNDGEFNDTSVEIVKNRVGHSGNIKFHVGIFPGTFKEFDRRFYKDYFFTITF
jgi:O-methyltransferase